MFGEDFLKKRKIKQFTIEDVENIVKQLGYECVRVNTHCTGLGKWKTDAVKDFRSELEKLKLTYFAYVKFYKKDEEKDKYALVAGKTNSWKDDVYFEELFQYKDDLDNVAENVVYHRKDKAKKWLATIGATWYYQEVLIIYCQELKKKESEEKDGTDDLRKLENLAYSIEADIGGLLGLFNS